MHTVKDKAQLEVMEVYSKAIIHISRPSVPAEDIALEDNIRTAAHLHPKTTRTPWEHPKWYLTGTRHNKKRQRNPVWNMERSAAFHINPPDAYIRIMPHESHYGVKTPITRKE